MVLAGLDFVISGNRTDPVLLLVHAMGSDLTFWDQCRAIWDEDFCSLAVSLRGAGRSPPLREAVNFASHVEDLELLRAELGLDRVVPVGCAVGAMIAATYAARYPQLCEGLVLTNPGLKTLPPARKALKARAAIVKKDGIEAVVDQTVYASFAGAVNTPLAKAFADAFKAQDPVSYTCAIEGMLDADLTPILSEILCPVLIVGGGSDGLLPFADHAMPLHDAIAASELVVVDDGAHFLPYQQAEKFACLVADFVRRAGRGA
jgi:3-oxoadipate enol-lactonase